MTRAWLLLASTALLAPGAAAAQSTGSQEVEEEIVVTATRDDDGVQGVVVPDVPKARAVLTQQVIARQSPGQSILNTINLVPGVNFTNNDAYGSSGGNLRIRGFDGNRISLTFDGVPLNDTGNYAIYSGQQLDPELIEQVSVNLGATDVDSPTASAAGGTVNYRTRIPAKTIGAMVQPSYGDHSFHRLFGLFDTGQWGNLGTRAFIAASRSRNDKFKGPGEIDKNQYNARLYQPLGGEDFVAISGHYNRLRNNFYRFLTLAQFEADPDLDNDAQCVRPAPGRGRQSDNRCSNYYGVRINPANTGNIRINSRFTLADDLVLTIDPSYQYVLANGGGIRAFNENSGEFRGANMAPGVDLNGDGDVADQIQLYTPNTTNTRRYGATASLIWDASAQHRFRLAYTYDRGRHRQTGEYGFLDSSGEPENVFGGRNGRPVLAADGTMLQQRDRLSIALLNQVAGEYRGKFLDSRLTVLAGLRAPFFKRELDQRCYTQRSNGFALCTSQPVATLSIVSPTNPRGALYLPYEKDYTFDALLPSVGASYRLGGSTSLFASFARGFSAPRTDNLYRTPDVEVKPETTNSFDLGVRHRSRRVQAQISGWMIDYSNRIVSSFDPDLGISLDRNIGKVESYGVDAQFAVQPADPLVLYLFGSYLNSETKDDVPLSATRTIATSGKKVPETPEWQFGGRAEAELGPLSLGLQAKYVGKRFATDLNDIAVDSYTLVDLDARLSLARVGLKQSWFQLNVINLFDKEYLANINTQIAGPANGGSSPSFSVGSPRTVMGSLRFGF